MNFLCFFFHHLPDCSLDCSNEVDVLKKTVGARRDTQVSQCETDIDECELVPCVHGNCSDSINSYICHCNPGYTGINCETEINECDSMPCVNGNCFESINYYTCQCHSGFTGLNCETNIDDCESTSCVGGSCSDMINAYTCICLPGYFGRHYQGLLIFEYLVWILLGVGIFAK